MKKKNKFDKLDRAVPMPKGGKVSNGYKTGGKPVEMTKANESQKVTVRGTGKARKQTATWY